MGAIINVVFNSANSAVVWSTSSDSASKYSKTWYVVGEWLGVRNRASIVFSSGSTVMATPSTVLDISPYTTSHSLALLQQTLLITHTTYYQWAGNSVSSANSATVTTAIDSTPGQYLYQCNATVTVAAQLSTVTIASNTVTVRGKQTLYHS